MHAIGHEADIGSELFHHRATALAGVPTDDDGVEVSLYCYVPPGADPLAATTQKEVIASFERTSLVGPPQQVQ